MSSTKKIAVLGSGNMGLAFAEGVAQAGLYAAANITLTRRNIDKLSHYQDKGFLVSNDNIKATKEADIIVLGVLPQQLNTLLDQIADSIDINKHLIISIISGVTCQDIKARLGKNVTVVRVMPNTAISIKQSMTCISGDDVAKETISLVQEMFDTVGTTIILSESQLYAATALCSSGIAFFLRMIRAATEAGVETGFHAHDALQMVNQTVKGAAELLIQTGSHPEVEIDKVTSPKGCTIAGLNEMESRGLSAAIIKGITIAANKAGNLYNKD